MERDTGFEPAPPAWKAGMLAADTNPAYARLSELSAELLVGETGLEPARSEDQRIFLLLYVTIALMIIG